MNPSATKSPQFHFTEHEINERATIGDIAALLKYGLTPAIYFSIFESDEVTTAVSFARFELMFILPAEHPLPSGQRG